MDWVQNIRDLARPYLTYFLPTAYVIFVFLGYVKKDIEFMEGVGMIAPLVTMIMTYHFMKASAKDKNNGG